MSTVSLPVSVINRARELFVLYSKKGAFQIEEYADAGAVYKRLVEASQSKEAADASDVSEIDVKYVISAINVCSQRTPVEVQNYKAISELLETLSVSLKVDEEVDETKSDL